MQAPRHYVPSNLLSIDDNPKTIKGQRYGFLTAVLYLAPHTLSGANLCPMAETAGCVAPCLNTAGNPAYARTKERGRLNKAHYFLDDRAGFLNQLAREIARHVRRAQTRGLTPLVRLNGTSDIRWERESFAINARTERMLGIPAGTVVPSLMSLFPGVQFYDYTKLSNRRDVPSNYDLTFSYSGVAGFALHVARARTAGMRIAVVFRSRRDIPASFMGRACVDGDDSDIRHLDPQGVVVALYAKGKARTDTSGFVVDTTITLPRRTIPLAIAA